MPPLRPSRHDGDDEHTRLGIALTVVQVLVFFGFMSLCTFQPALLRQDPLHLGLPLSFVAGLAVIVCGIVLTAAYVSVANRSPEH
ncbi:hypothetical protein BGC_45250 [Burkholderia sp. 3C]